MIQNIFNPFNSLKALTHVPNWKKMINTGILKPPIQISLDMANVCQFNCIFCNAIEARKRKDIMSLDTINKVIDLASYKVTQSFCVGGGGESLCNPNFGYFVDQVHKLASIGVVTNGMNIDKYLESLMKCKWVGISLDAATPKIYSKLKGTTEENFDKVVNNIKLLVDSGHKDVTIKYLMWPDNIVDINKAAILAKKLGVRRFQVRPGDAPWFSKNDSSIYSDYNVRYARMQMNRISQLADDNFEVYTVTQNFDNKLGRKLDFSKCYAGLFNIIMYPNGDVGLCVDRRGDKDTYLCNIDELHEVWGSEEHKEKVANLDLSKCPRCTFRVHNLIFENVVLKDNMYCEFVG